MKLPSNFKSSSSLRENEIMFIRVQNEAKHLLNPCLASSWNHRMVWVEGASRSLPTRTILLFSDVPRSVWPGVSCSQEQNSSLLDDLASSTPCLCSGAATALSDPGLASKGLLKAEQCLWGPWPLQDGASEQFFAHCYVQEQTDLSLRLLSSTTAQAPALRAGGVQGL